MNMNKYTTDDIIAFKRFDDCLYVNYWTGTSTANELTISNKDLEDWAESNNYLTHYDSEGEDYQVDIEYFKANITLEEITEYLNDLKPIIKMKYPYKIQTKVNELQNEFITQVKNELKLNQASALRVIIDHSMTRKKDLKIATDEVLKQISKNVELSKLLTEKIDVINSLTGDIQKSKQIKSENAEQLLTITQLKHDLSHHKGLNLDYIHAVKSARNSAYNWQVAFICSIVVMIGLWIKLL